MQQLTSLFLTDPNKHGEWLVCVCDVIKVIVFLLLTWKLQFSSSERCVEMILIGFRKKKDSDGEKERNHQEKEKRFRSLSQHNASEIIYQYLIKLFVNQNSWLFWKCLVIRLKQVKSILIYSHKFNWVGLNTNNKISKPRKPIEKNLILCIIWVKWRYKKEEWHGAVFTHSVFNICKLCRFSQQKAGASVCDLDRLLPQNFRVAFLFIRMVLWLMFKGLLVLYNQSEEHPYPYASYYPKHYFFNFFSNYF